MYYSGFDYNGKGDEGGVPFLSMLHSLHPLLDRLDNEAEALHCCVNVSIPSLMEDITTRL